MGFSSVIILSILFLACSSTEAYNFIVGGKNGWSTHPSEDYKQWAGRMRYSINDTLSFKYPKQTDSVVVVSKDDYDKCNAATPIVKLDGGDSTFKFDRSGPFFFITSNKTNCDQGQKLVIVVLALRNKSPPTPPASSPSPSTQAPVPSPESLTPGPSPSSESPAPGTSGPAVSPAPGTSGPAVSPAPGTSGPAVSPAPGTSGPAVSPAPGTSGPAVSPAPGTSGPAANAPGTDATPSPLSPENTPADISSPPGTSNSFAPTVSPAMVVSVVLSATVAAFITFT